MWVMPSCRRPKISLVEGSFFSTGFPLLNQCCSLEGRRKGVERQTHNAIPVFQSNRLPFPVHYGHIFLTRPWKRSTGKPFPFFLKASSIKSSLSPCPCICTYQLLWISLGAFTITWSSYNSARTKDMGRETGITEVESCTASKKSMPTGNILQNHCYDSFPWGATD